jgi:hypothetical protein
MRKYGAVLAWLCIVAARSVITIKLYLDVFFLKGRGFVMFPKIILLKNRASGKSF